MSKKWIALIAVVLIVVAIAVLVVINKPEKAGDFYVVSEDGTKVNNSEKLHKTKNFEGLKFSEFIDKDGNTLDSLNWYAPKLLPGDSTQLSTSASINVTVVYDFTLGK